MTKTSTWLRGSCLGRGAYGTVSAAVNASTGEVFAVKSVDLSTASPSHAEALENEIAMLKSLASPFIVKYLGDDTTAEGSPAASFRNLHVEYYPGGTAADLPDSGEAAVASYAWCVLSALSYLHNRGIVHCDVKGRNVLLGGSPGSAVLADFGSAAEVSSAAAAAGRGSPLWMAPEVVRGEYQGPESDVWSLGCTVIEMVTAKPAWGAEAGSVYRIGYSEELPLFPARLSASGADFLEKCLRRDYAQRWSCDQLLQHPFVSMGPRKETANHRSPRCVLDGLNFEFHDEEEKLSDDEEIVKSQGNERIRGLVSEAGVNWESEGWLVVRGESDGEGDGGGTCSEFPDLMEERTSLGASSGFGATNLLNLNCSGRIVNSRYFSFNNCSDGKREVKTLLSNNYGFVYHHLHVFFNFTLIFLDIISRKFHLECGLSF